MTVISSKLKSARQFLLILLATTLFFGQIPAQTKVVAHRGYWKTKGSAQNTITSLKKAHEVGANASEFDVNMTSDGVLVVCHGPKVGNLPRVQEATYAQVKQITLANGDKVPTLEQFLEAGKSGFDVTGSDGSSERVKLPLVLEIKKDTPEREQKIVPMIAQMVKRLGIEDRVIIISFSLNACVESAKQLPECHVQYLNGDKSPVELKELGIGGLDYHYKVMLSHPEWIEQAHDLGMSVNVWTVDKPINIKKFVKLGVDYITTDKPKLAKRLVKKHSPK